MIPRWLLWTLVALLSWGVWAMLSKVIGDALTAAQSQALSTLGLLPILGGLALMSKRADTRAAEDAPSIGPNSKSARRRCVRFAFVAGVLGCMGNVAYYHALSLGEASSVVPLTALYPLVTVVLAFFFLREKLNPVQMTGLALALVAIYLFNVPSGAGWVSPWLLYALVPIALWGVTGLLQKISTQRLSGEASTFWFLLAFVPVAVVLLLAQGWPAQLTPKIWGLVIALGFFFGLGNYGLLAAFATQGKAAVIMPLSGLYPLVSLPLALWLLHEKLGVREGAGLGVALLSVVALACETPSRSAPGPA